jgi:thioredoxin 2
MTLQMDDRGVIVPCGACGRGNRLAFETLDRQTRCGHCKVAVTAPAAPVAVGSTASFDAAVRSSALPLIVDFWAPWCGPCRMVAPELEKVARAHAGHWLVLKINTDEQPELGERFRIRSIPTLAVFQGGQELTRVSGARPASDIERLVEGATVEGASRVS